MEARFWEAVEREDLEALTTTLEIDQQTRLCELLPALSSWRRGQSDRATVDSWRYRITWSPVSVEERTAPLSGTWLLAVPEGRADSAQVADVAAALDRRGAHVARLTLSTTGRGTLAERLRQAVATGGTPAGVLSLLALDDGPHPEHTSLTSGLALNVGLIQALGDAGIAAPLWLATAGAVSVSGSDPLGSPAQAATWGLGRVVALEHPQRWGVWSTSPGTSTSGRPTGCAPRSPASSATAVRRTSSPSATPGCSSGGSSGRRCAHRAARAGSRMAPC
ncbi:hypothetical protein GCM10017744_016160 [Streptomyces antimycoticus]